MGGGMGYFKQKGNWDEKSTGEVKRGRWEGEV